jgi:hypothetical protein
LTNLPRYLFTTVENPFKKFNVKNQFDVKQYISEGLKKKMSSKRDTIYMLVAVVARINTTKTLNLDNDLNDEHSSDNDFYTVVRSHYNSSTKNWTWKKFSPG